ncbi:Ttll9, partial [Symbiodinium sp. CCMP2456]
EPRRSRDKRPAPAHGDSEQSKLKKVREASLFDLVKQVLERWRNATDSDLADVAESHVKYTPCRMPLKRRFERPAPQARVAVMVVGVELQQKLLQRLRMLPSPGPQTETPTPDVNKKPSPSKSSPDEDRLEAFSAEAKRLKEMVLNAKKAQVRKLKEEAERFKAHKANRVVEVQTESDRVLAEAEVTAAKMSQVTQADEEDETNNVTMTAGSDDEQEDDNEEEEARVLNQLELSYEGLELSQIMPLPAAVRLATGHISHQDTMSKADIPETGFMEREGVEFGRWTRPSPSGNAEWTEEELEAEYREHLRNLKKVC